MNYFTTLLPQFSDELQIIAPEFDIESLKLKNLEELHDLQTKADMLLGANSAVANKKKLYASW